MIYFVEFWNTTDAWHALSTEERGAYMNQVASATQSLIEQGVEVLTWSKNDPATDQRAAYDYFAIWTFPNQEIADVFQQTVAQAGWYTYFEQVNTMGEQNSVGGVIEQLIQL